MSLIKIGDRVKVDFISESATIYSGKRFTGYGVVDLFEDNRVFGRLEDGQTFMCFASDVEVLTGRGGAKAMRENFEKLTASSPSYLKLVFQHGERLFIFEDGQYKIAAVQLAWEIFIEKQTEVDELQKRVDLLEKAEFKLAQVREILQNNPKLLESILVKKIEQALKGGVAE